MHMWQPFCKIDIVRKAHTVNLEACVGPIFIPNIFSTNVAKKQLFSIFLGLNPNALDYRARILVQVTIYRRLLIGRDGHLDQSEAYDIS